MDYRIGVDLGGTKTLAVAVNEEGQVLGERRFPTSPERGPDSVLEDIAKTVGELQDELGAPAQMLGVGIAGQVDSKSGYLNYGPNLSWRDVSLSEPLQQTLSLPTTVLNDVRAAMVGETKFGAAKGYSSALGIFIGTGIGGGFISAGCLLEGATGSACEIGHVIVDFKGPLCSCGNQGCVEVYAAGWGIAARARERVAARESGYEAFPSLEQISAKDVFKLSQSQNPLAAVTIAEMESALTSLLISSIHAFNPACLVFGGGIIDGHPQLIERLKKRVVKKALPIAVSSIVFSQSILGPSAVAIGAAFYQREVKS